MLPGESQVLTATLVTGLLTLARFLETQKTLPFLIPVFQLPTMTSMSL